MSNQITRALQRQVIYGGDLPTNLLELDLLDEKRLVEYTGAAYAMAVLPAGSLDNIPPETLKKVPFTFVSENRSLPFNQQDKRVSVAVAKPLEKEVLNKLGTKTGCEVLQFVTTGFRLAMWLNRYYGIDMPARLASLQRKYEPSFQVGQTPLVTESEFEGLEVDEIQIPTDAEADKPRGSVETSQIISIGKLTEPAKEKSKAPAKPPVKPAAAPAAVAPARAPVKPTAKPTAPPRPVTPVATGGVQHVAGRAAPDHRQTQRRIPIAPEMPGKPAAPPVSVVSGGPAAVVATSKPEERPESTRRRVSASTAYDGDGLGPRTIETPDAGRISYNQAQKKLENATHRDQIFDLAVGFLRQLFDFVGVFMIQGDEAQGRVAAHSERGVFKIDQYAFSLTEQSIFHTVLDTQAFYLGPPVNSAYDAEIMKVLVRRPPNCAVMPVLIGGRAALIIYADRGKRKISSRRMSELARFTSLMGAAFMRLVLEQKSRVARPSFVGGSAPPSTPNSEGTQPRIQMDMPSAVKTKAALRPTDASNKPSGDLPMDFDDEEIEIEESDLIEEIMDGGIGPELDEVTKVQSAEVMLTDGTGDQPRLSLMTTPPPSMTAASGISAERLQHQTVIVQMDAELGRLIERVLSPGKFDDLAADLLLGMGDDALSRLVSLFPGPVRHDKYSDSGHLLRITHHGPIFKALLKFERRAVPYILPLLENPDVEIRFYATFIFSELIHEEAIGPLTSRLFDFEPHIRALAMDVLKGYAHFPEYRFAVKSVIDTLGMPGVSLVVLRTAAEVLGELRERVAVPPLLAMLAHDDQKLRQKAYEALVKVTFVDMGTDLKRWQDWWNKNRGQHRIAWAIGGLSAKNEQIAFDAACELKRLTWESFAWPEDLFADNKYNELSKQCNDWWSRVGHHLYPVLEEQ